MKRLIDAYALKDWICANAPDFLKADDFAIALDFILYAINEQKTVVCVSDDFQVCPKESRVECIMCGGACCEKP